MKWLVSFFAKKLPYSFQGKIEDACCAILQKLKTNYIIKYKGFTVQMPTTDVAASHIYFRYLLTGVWFHESYEQLIVEKIISKLNLVWFIDAGASYGLYTLIAASLPSVKTVVAIEASPIICKYLKNTISQNNLNSKVCVRNAAVASKSGWTYQVINHENSEWSKAVKSTACLDDAIISVSVDDLIPYDELSSNATIFIKMDIEGCEPDAFDGMCRLFSSSFNYIILFEFHVGLLNLQKNGAYLFAQKIMDHCHGAILQVDAAHKRLITIKSIREFNEIIDAGMMAAFPGNVFNLLIVKGAIDLQF